MKKLLLIACCVTAFYSCSKETTEIEIPEDTKMAVNDNISFWIECTLGRPATGRMELLFSIYDESGSRPSPFDIKFGCAKIITSKGGYFFIDSWYGDEAKRPDPNNGIFQNVFNFYLDKGRPLSYYASREVDPSLLEGVEWMEIEEIDMWMPGNYVGRNSPVTEVQHNGYNYILMMDTQRLYIR